MTERTYGIEYSWRDGMYGLHVVASSPEEAMERVRAAASRGRCYTPYGIEAIIHVKPRWMQRLVLWWLGKSETPDAAA